MNSRSLSGKGLLITMLVLFGVCFLQATYWVVDQMGFARSFHTEMARVLEQERDWANGSLESGKRANWVEGHPHLMLVDGLVELDKPAIKSVERDIQSRINRYRWEGGFFLLVLGLGIFVLIRTLRQHALLLRSQRNFMASVGHELRSPLASIKLSAETLEMRDCEPEQVRSLTERMLQGVFRLESFVNNILESARLEGGQRQPVRQEIPLDIVVSEVIEQVRTGYPDVTIEAHLVDSPMLFADAIGVQAVVQNLIDNACKSASAAGGGQVDVEVSRNGQGTTLRVQDDGLGFAPEETERLFQRFYRVGDELTRKTKGSGLGLHIANAAMEMEQGKLEARSAGPGEGATFSAHWPATALAADDSSMETEVTA